MTSGGVMDTPALCIHDDVNLINSERPWERPWSVSGASVGRHVRAGCVDLR